MSKYSGCYWVILNTNNSPFLLQTCEWVGNLFVWWRNINEGCHRLKHLKRKNREAYWKKKEERKDMLRCVEEEEEGEEITQIKELKNHFDAEAKRISFSSFKRIMQSLNGG